MQEHFPNNLSEEVQDRFHQANHRMHQAGWPGYAHTILRMIYISRFHKSIVKIHEVKKHNHKHMYFIQYCLTLSNAN